MKSEYFMSYFICNPLQSFAAIALKTKLNDEKFVIAKYACINDSPTLNCIHNSDAHLLKIYDLIVA